MTLRPLIHVAAALSVILSMSACSSDGCTNNQNSIPMAGFYDASNGEAITISGLSVSGVNAPNDSLILAPTANAHQVWLPFRGSNTEAAFQFSSGAFTDIVTFTYESFPYFDGEDCGAMWRYRITDVTHSGLLIDSILVTDPLITNIERERIMIFLNVPSDSDEEEEE